jgi:hypothetical protein
LSKDNAIDGYWPKGQFYNGKIASQNRSRHGWALLSAVDQRRPVQCHQRTDPLVRIAEAVVRQGDARALDREQCADQWITSISTGRRPTRLAFASGAKRLER